MRILPPVLALAAIIGASCPSLAGDFAYLKVIGFSPDGGTFAFEEFGEYDGSGGHYSSIYVIDTNTDSWVTGTPIRVSPEDVDLSLAVVRGSAAKKAQAVLAKYKIQPLGLAVVSNPATEQSNNPYSVRFKTELYANTAQIWQLDLTPIRLPEPAGCENLGPTQGFRLVLTDPAANSTILNEDKALPASRHCAQDYAIDTVVTYTPPNRQPVMVVLLDVITQGFEGPDRRFLAVATHFQDY
jgi:predicted secreted protein